MGSEKCELFSPTLLWKVEVAILKFGRPLHFLKSRVRRERKPTHARSLGFLGKGGAKGSFIDLVFGYLAFKFVDRSPKRFRS
jgi:hypothetical protein